MNFKQTITLLTLCVAWPSLNAHAADYYSDPIGGSMTNDGSAGAPWGSLKQIFDLSKTFDAGDTIFLMNGPHGQAFITGYHTNYVSIKAMPGHTPKVSTIQLESGSYWAFDGITFTLDGSGGPSVRDYMISTQDTSTYLKFENCDFYFAEDSSSWSKTDWYANTGDKAIIIRGDHLIFNSNTILNTYFALQVEGDYVEVKNNLIDNFGADAIRALGSHAIYEGNTIRDAYIEDYNVNHDDGIQMYDKDNVAGGVVEDVVIRNNIIMNFADPITPAMSNDNRVGYSMQGIICTDGFTSNVVVENNLVVSDHYHGIALPGAANCRLQNNTVIKTPTSLNPITNAFPWVQFHKSKNNRQPANSIIRNNIASFLTPWSHADGTNITDEHNIELPSGLETNYFVNYTNFNFNLTSGSPAINAGISTDITATDLAGQPRLVGSGVDCGAYESSFTEDHTPPELTGADDTFLNKRVAISFSETVTQTTAENPANYSIDGGVYVIGATLEPDNSTATLTTSELIDGYIHTVTANGVEDDAGNPSSNTTASFTYLCDTRQASTYQDDEYGTHPPENAFDGDLSTKWAAHGTQWIEAVFCSGRNVKSVDIAFPFGDARNYYFTIETSLDGLSYTQVLSGTSSGVSTNLEHFDFVDIAARHVKITGYGNSVNGWNNNSEIVINGDGAALSEYEVWISHYPGIGTATNMTDNPDGDSLDNLGEWSLGGNPDDQTNRGHPPAFTAAGSNWYEYVYAKRNNAADLGLTYWLEQNTNLPVETWTSNMIEIIGAGPLDGEFDSITNRIWINGEYTQFLRLNLRAE